LVFPDYATRTLFAFAEQPLDQSQRAFGEEPVPLPVLSECDTQEREARMEAPVTTQEQ